jgi:hypothetical protein
MDSSSVARLCQAAQSLFILFVTKPLFVFDSRLARLFFLPNINQTTFLFTSPAFPSHPSHSFVLPF